MVVSGLRCSPLDTESHRKTPSLMHLKNGGLHTLKAYLVYPKRHARIPRYPPKRHATESVIRTSDASD